MTAPEEQDGLFEVRPGLTHYKPQPTFVLPDEPDYRRGPGPSTTRGPEDAKAPDWWKAEAERVVLQLAAEQGRVTADDLHRWYGAEPSASGAAIGHLFRRLGREGRLVLVGYEPSTRAARRGSVTGVWRLAGGSDG